MTKEKEIGEEVEKRIGLINALNKESTQTQILLEYQETIKTEMCVNWLNDINKKRNNPKVQDVVNIVRIRLSKHKKIVSDLIHFESKANYYEMLSGSLRSGEEQIKYMEELLLKIKKAKLCMCDEVKKYG